MRPVQIRKESYKIAINHCSIRIISRGKGRSAVASAAYRAAEIIKSEYNGAVHDIDDGNPHAHIMLTLRPFNEENTFSIGELSKLLVYLDLCT